MNRTRVFAILAILGAGLAALPHPGQAAGAGGAVVQQAALRLAHQSPAGVARWLRTQPDVRSAAVMPDGRTLRVSLPSGGSILILPAATPAAHLPALKAAHAAAGAAAAAPGARALVLEPFATELGLGSNAGQPEVSALQAAGFSVKSSYDTAVTINSLASMSNYNVVYMHTHSGVDQSGHGVLASGEQAPCGSYSNSDGSVVTVGVAGSNQCYYAITSVYIRDHMGTFPAHSLVFLNGCALLNSSEFIGALTAQGVGVTLSWDNDATAGDDYLSAAAFFNVMQSGATVSSALQTLLNNGYGVSTVNNQTARLGYRGDGSITLAEAAAGGAGTPPSATPGPPTSTPFPPTSTPFPPTSTPIRPTSTPIPPTATPVRPSPTPPPPPITPAVSLRGTVKAGNSQQIVVGQLPPGSTVSVHIQFPNGDQAGGTVNADGAGTARYTFVQPGNRITRNNRTADVTINLRTNAGTIVVRGQYKIGYGAIDLVVQPAAPGPGQTVTVWIHTHKHASIKASILRDGKLLSKILKASTRSNAWTSVHYRLPRRLAANTRLSAQAQATWGKHHAYTIVGFSVS